jgi:hypothetical protein
MRVPFADVVKTSRAKGMIPIAGVSLKPEGDAPATGACTSKATDAKTVAIRRCDHRPSAAIHKRFLMVDTEIFTFFRSAGERLLHPGGYVRK